LEGEIWAAKSSAFQLLITSSSFHFMQSVKSSLFLSQRPSLGPQEVSCPCPRALSGYSKSPMVRWCWACLRRPSRLIRTPLEARRFCLVVKFSSDGILYNARHYTAAALLKSISAVKLGKRPINFSKWNATSFLNNLKIF
jgi:hypothetical protein